MGRTPPGETRERVYRFVRERLLTGAPPTIREVQDAFEFRSVGTAREHLEALVSEGRLVKERGGRHRGHRLAGRPSSRPTILIPLLGRVQAGALTAAVQDVEEYITAQSRFAPDDLFALRVRGDSMAPEILQGDIVIVRRQPRAESGEIVVALVENEATVKRLKLARGRLELIATNPKYAPIVPEPDAVAVLGRVIELRRELGSPRRAGRAR